MSDVSSPRAVDRSVVQAGFAIGLLAVGAVCGVLYLLSAYVRGQGTVPMLLFLALFAARTLALERPRILRQFTVQ